MFFKQKIKGKHALALLLSVVMVFSLFVGNTVSVFAASSIAVPSWAEGRLYFHTIGNDTTDSQAWAVMETTAAGTGSTPSSGSYSSGTGFRVFLPETAKNSDGTYLVYNNYGTDITIGGKTIGSGKTGYVSANSNSVRIGYNGTYSLKIYTSNAEENIYFTHKGGDTKDKYNGGIYSAQNFVSALGMDWSKGSKSDVVVTNGNVTLVQANGTIDTTQTFKQIKGRGNTTWKNTNKKSWNFTLNDEKVSVGGMKKGKKYSLLANFQDPSLSRNRLLYDLADSVGVPYVADSRYADVYVDGLYVGSYLLTQKNDSLADLQDPVYENGSVKSADFLIELACSSQGDDFEITPGNGSGILSVSFPEVDTLNGGQKDALRRYIKEKYDALYNALCDSSKSYEELSKLADVESLAKVYLINELSKNFDAGVSSFYLTFENGKFVASPVWDYDNSLGNCNTTPSVASDYKSTSGNWCSVWKGNNQRYSGNLVRRFALNPVVQEVARACWFGTSKDDTTSFVYNINNFANSTSTSAKLGKNTGLLTKNYYLKVLKNAANNNFKKWYIVPSNWCGGHTGLKMYKVDYDNLYSKLDTNDYSVSSAVSLSSSSRSYSEYSITASGNNGGQYEYAADYMISRAAWMSVNMLKVAKSYNLAGQKIGWSTGSTGYKLTAKGSGIYGITDIDANLLSGYFKLNDGTSYIGPSGTSDVSITTETTYDSKKAYSVTGSIAGAEKAYVFTNPDKWSKVSVFYRPSDGKIWITAGQGTSTPTPTITPTVKPTVKPTVVPGKNQVVVYYKRSATTSWTNAYIHYKVNNGTWTTSPGVKMTKISGGYWSYTINLGNETGATVCFNNGSGSWDSNNGANYTVGKGAYLVTSGSGATQMEATAAPTSTPTVKPTTTPIVKPTVTPTVVPGKNQVTVYYKRSENTSWTDAYMHYKVNNGAWTVAPGVKMTKISGGYWSYTINLGNETRATLCFNNGSGSWDSNNSANYTVGKGTWLVTSGSGATQMEATTAPTSTPTVTPANKNTVVVYYNRGTGTSWTDAYVHYKVNNGTWTTAPGVKMTKISAGYWKCTIDLGKETGATLCFNNGNGTWDSNGGNNYTCTKGTYSVTK